MMVFALSYAFYFAIFCYCLGIYSFLMRDRNGIDLHGRGYGEQLVEVEGKEAVFD